MAAKTKKHQTLDDTLDDRIALIVGAIDKAKAKAIRRINKQLDLMSPKDVATLERLLGKR